MFAWLVPIWYITFFCALWVCWWPLALSLLSIALTVYFLFTTSCTWMLLLASLHLSDWGWRTNGCDWTDYSAALTTFLAAFPFSASYCMLCCTLFPPLSLASQIHSFGCLLLLCWRAFLLGIQAPLQPFCPKACCFFLTWYSCPLSKQVYSCISSPPLTQTSPLFTIVFRIKLTLSREFSQM